MSNENKRPAGPAPIVLIRIGPKDSVHHEGAKFTKFKSINIRTLRVLRAFVVSPLFFAPFVVKCRLPLRLCCARSFVVND